MRQLLPLIAFLGACAPEPIPTPEPEPYVIGAAAASAPPPWVGMEPESKGPVVWPSIHQHTDFLVVVGETTEPDTTLECQVFVPPVTGQRRRGQVESLWIEKADTRVELEIEIALSVVLRSTPGLQLRCESDRPVRYQGLLVWPLASDSALINQ